MLYTISLYRGPFYNSTRLNCIKQYLQFLDHDLSQALKMAFVHILMKSVLIRHVQEPITHEKNVEIPKWDFKKKHLSFIHNVHSLIFMHLLPSFHVTDQQEQFEKCSAWVFINFFMVINLFFFFCLSAHLRISNTYALFLFLTIYITWIWSHGLMVFLWIFSVLKYLGLTLHLYKYFITHTVGQC